MKLGNRGDRRCSFLVVNSLLMKKFLLLVVFLCKQATINAQCVNDYVGEYRVYDCGSQLYSHNSNVAQWGNWTFTINNFEGGFSQNAILIGEINCSNGEVEFDSTYFYVGTDHWFVGDGTFNQDSLIVNLRHYFWHPVEGEWNGPNNDCWVYKRLEANVQELLLGAIQLKPNPAREFLEIQSSLNLNDCIIKVYDVLGHLISVEDRFEKRIDISSLQPGMYILELESGRDFIRRKFLVQE